MILISAPLIASAQTSPGNLNLSVNPEFPKAGETFSVGATSYSFDTLRANFIWVANGKTVASGKGITERAFTAGALGSATKISVTATSPEGYKYNTSVTVSINDVDFAMHPLTYTPPFYRGAALPSPRSEIEIVATAHLFSAGARLGSKTLIYEWSVDGAPLKANSGQGKNKIILELPRGTGEHEVELFVSSAGGSVTYRKNIKIKVYSPEILFYETSPLTGPRPLAISNYYGRQGTNFSIIAELYFLDISSFSSANLSWSTNGQIINQENGKNPRILDLNAPEGSASQTSFTFTVDDIKKTLQKLSASFMVIIQ